MRVKIYQIDVERDTDRVKFQDLNSTLDRTGGKIDASKYNEVFNAVIPDCGLEDIFRQFNTEGHPLFRGHSLSVSDVVCTTDGAFYCDTIGFKKIAFNERETQKPDNLMRIVYVEPNRKPYVAEIPKTLEAEQKAVGGYIEPIYNDDYTCLVGNEEAKLIGLEGNRHLDNGTSIIAGAFFVCGLTEDDFRSLEDEEVGKYMEKFAEPETITPEEVQADTGYMIFWG